MSATGTLALTVRIQYPVQEEQGGEGALCYSVRFAR